MKTKEIKVYGIDINTMSINDDRVIENLSNEDFITESEKEGFVWTLAGFSYDFNRENLPYDLIIRFIAVESEDLQFSYLNTDQKYSCINE